MPSGFQTSLFLLDVLKEIVKVLSNRKIKVPTMNSKTLTFQIQFFVVVGAK